MKTLKTGRLDRRSTATERVRAWRRARQQHRWQAWLPAALRPRIQVNAEVSAGR